MLFRLVSTLAVAALAGQAVAEPKPYKPDMAKMSVRNMFANYGVQRRQTDGGYQPENAFCGTGTTCAEACGAGFEQCGSIDAQVHCFNATAQQSCCSSSTGDSCDAGYYCSGDNAGTTWCCPEGTTTEACAAAFGVAGGLTTLYPTPTTTTTLTSTSVLTHYATPTINATVVVNATVSVNATAYATKVIVVVPTGAGYNTTALPFKSTGGYHAATYSATQPGSPAATTALKSGAASAIKESLGMVVVLAGAAFAALL